MSGSILREVALLYDSAQGVFSPKPGTGKIGRISLQRRTKFTPNSVPISYSSKSFIYLLDSNGEPSMKIRRAVSGESGLSQNVRFIIKGDDGTFPGEELFDESLFRRGGGLGGAGDGTVGGDLRCISSVATPPPSWHFKYVENRFFELSCAFSSDDDDVLDSSSNLTLSVRYLRLGDNDADLRNKNTKRQADWVCYGMLAEPITGSNQVRLIG